MKPQHSKLGAMLALTLGASAMANGAAAVTLYDNLGSDPATNFWLAYDLPGNTYLANQFYATPSLCTPHCELASVSLFMYGADILGNPISSADFRLDIYSDAPGGIDTNNNSVHIPGGLLHTLTNPVTFTVDSGINVFTPSSTFLLSPNTYYWVRFSSQAADSVYWNTITNSFNSQSETSQPSNSLRKDPAGLYWISNPALDNSSSNQFTGFPAETFMMKVEVVQTGNGDTPPVPIPGAVWLMGSSLAGLVLWRRRKAG